MRLPVWALSGLTPKSGRHSGYRGRLEAHKVTNGGSDRAQLANLAKQAKAVLKTETLDAVADRGYFSGPEILACHETGITVTLPKIESG